MPKDKTPLKEVILDEAKELTDRVKTYASGEKEHLKLSAVVILGSVKTELVKVAKKIETKIKKL